MGSSSGQSSGSYDHSYKILLIGDAGVGKSSILASFVSDPIENLNPTLGVDIKMKVLTVGGKKLKLTIWDTSGRDRFRTLRSSYYRDANGIILVYDITRRDTFTNLSDVWIKELELYSANQDCVKLFVGNKLDRDSERVVSKKEGIARAKELGCEFFEGSAKTRENVDKYFEQLALKIMEVLGHLRMVSSSGQSSGSYDHSYKVLLIGDAGVGKSSILVSFLSSPTENLDPTVGVDIKIKLLTVGGTKLKLTIWDTSGSERYRTLKSSLYYKDAHGIILVYDITRRHTFTNLSDAWLKEVELYSNNQACVKILIGNKVDKNSKRVVSKEEGIARAKELGCEFFEGSAKTRENVDKCFEQLVLKIMEVHGHLKQVPTTPEKKTNSEPKQEQKLEQPKPKPPESSGGGGGGGGGGDGSGAVGSCNIL